MTFPTILQRFLTYIQIDTQSSETSQTFPSTSKQINLALKIKDELEELGITDVVVNEWGYLLATLPSNQPAPVPTIALLGHLDTSPDVSGTDVKPQIHDPYNGADIVLNAATGIVLKTDENPYLKEKIGHTIITTDGNTLLGADDKAGIAEIMDALTYLIQHADIPRPKMRIVLTPDEETGRGTEHLTTAEIGADVGYTVDGERVGEIEDETFNADTVEIKINGVNVHPGKAKGKLVNAVKIAAAVIDRFHKDSLSPETTEKRQGYIHPHAINGGVEETIIKILIRDFSEAGLTEKETYIKDVCQEVGQLYPAAKIECQVIPSYRNMKIILDKYPEIMKKAEQAVAMASLEPERQIIRGGTDGARLSFMGLPTPNLFTGGNNYHSRYEWVSLQDMQKASEVIVNLMRIWAQG